MPRTTLSFTNRIGLRLKGILFEPEARAQETGVIYLPGTVLGLTAVHRLSLDVASEFQKMGYPVLLFDHSGIGESEGELFSGAYEEFVNFIKRGSLVDDTEDAIDYFLKRCALKNVILVGHCGGALTAVYTAEKSRRISRLLLISPPLAGESSEPTGMSKAQSGEYLKLYKNKLFSVDAWKRLFSGKSDYRQMLRMVKTKILARMAKGAKPSNERLNRRLLDGLESAGKKISVKIIYGLHDPGIEEFKAWQDTLGRWNVRTTIIANASHGFVTEESMAMLRAELKG